MAVHGLAGLLLEMGRTDSPVDINFTVVVLLVKGSTKQVLGPDIRVTETSGAWVAHHLDEVCERHFRVEFEEEGLAVVDVKLLGEDRVEKVPVLEVIRASPFVGKVGDVLELFEGKVVGRHD